MDGGSTADLQDKPDSWAALETQLIEHEAIRLKPYLDTVNKLTIGVGRNLTDKGLSRSEALFLLRNDISEARQLLDRHLPWWRNQTEVRRRVLVDMAFNLGIYGLLTFKRFLAALQAGGYYEAAREMRESTWAHQVGARATRLARMVETGHEVALSEVEA